MKLAAKLYNIFMNSESGCSAPFFSLWKTSAFYKYTIYMQCKYVTCLYNYSCNKSTSEFIEFLEDLFAHTRHRIISMVCDL